MIQGQWITYRRHFPVARMRNVLATDMTLDIILRLVHATLGLDLSFIIFSFVFIFGCLVLQRNIISFRVNIFLDMLFVLRRYSILKHTQQSHYSKFQL